MLQGTGSSKFPFKDTSSHLAHLSTFSSIPLPSSFYGILLYFTKIITRPQCEYQHDEAQPPQRAPHQHRNDPPPPRPPILPLRDFPAPSSPRHHCRAIPHNTRESTGTGTGTSTQHTDTRKDRLVYGTQRPQDTWPHCH